MTGELWVEKAFKLLHHYISQYTKDTNIPPEWVAGLIFVECASLNPKASRFEQNVYTSVMWTKKGNVSTAFPGFRFGKIQHTIYNTNDISKLKSIATSYGLGQMMGYNYIDKWDLKPEQYMNLSIEDSIKYLVLFMKLNMEKVHFPYIEKSTTKILPYAQLLRCHNTGKTTGTTYNPDYVKNATEMADKYKQYAEKQGSIINGPTEIKF